MAKVAKRRGYSYRITDLDYPAVTVKNPINAVGAKIGGGKAFAFGRSVTSGVRNLQDYYNSTMRSCPATLWVLGGYSQGALVAARAVKSFAPAQVVYVGLFGDPWTYLPEGKGLSPKACKGRGLSAYRVHVPECKTYSGSLGMSNPYEASGLEGKYGLWCNRQDYICGSTKLLFDMAGHSHYADFGELTWMSEKVDQKLKKRQRMIALASAEDSSDEEDIPDSIQAHLPTDQYRIMMDGTVELDASESFSSGHEIVEYLWSVNGRAFESTGNNPKLSRTVYFPEKETIILRVVDDVGQMAETTIKIITHEYEGEPYQIPAPQNVSASYASGEIQLDWIRNWPYMAKYILVRIDGVDLDFVPVTELSGVIDGIESTDVTLEVAWLDKDYMVGEWTKLDIEEKDPPEEINIEPVQTGLSMPELATSLFILGIATIGVIANKKYLPQ